MGELAAYYLSADIAFVGGSLVDAGCQNIIEPISCRVPHPLRLLQLLTSPKPKGAVEAKAAVRVETAEPGTKPRANTSTTKRCANS